MTLAESMRIPGGEVQDSGRFALLARAIGRDMPLGRRPDMRQLFRLLELAAPVYDGTPDLQSENAPELLADLWQLVDLVRALPGGRSGIITTDDLGRVRWDLLGFPAPRVGTLGPAGVREIVLRIRAVRLAKSPAYGGNL